MNITNVVDIDKLDIIIKNDKLGINDDLYNIFFNAILKNIVNDYHYLDWCGDGPTSYDYEIDMHYIVDSISICGNILKEYNIDYNLDNIYEYLKENINISDIEGDISDIEEDIEYEIIEEYANMYLYDYFCQNDDYNWLIIDKEYKNMIKYNIHKNKHSRLISLYKKLKDLDIKNKEKKIISRILNNKFNRDIIDSILNNY